VELIHPSEAVWDAYSHTFQRVDTNIYVFTGTVEGNIETNWEIEFAWWGFKEELTSTYPCAEGTCGCIVTGENRLSK